MVKQIISHKPTRVFLILGGIFISNALLAEVIGVKIFSLERTLSLPQLNASIFGEMLSLNLTAGVMIWPVVFVLTDIINEYYGRKGVKFLTYLTVCLIAFAFFVFMGSIWLAPADFFVTSKQGSGVPDMQQAYKAILGQGANIIVASLVAFILGQLVDVFSFQRIKKVTGEKMIWLRATGSTIISQFIDSFVVLFVAFYLGSRINPQPGDLVWPLKLVLAVCIVNYIYKFIIAILMTPVIYWVHSIIEKYLGHEVAAKMKKEALDKD